jgi:hypothetical protein
VIRWVLASGGLPDREVEEPGTTDEIVILRTEQVPGRAWQNPGLQQDADHDGIDDTVIVFAYAGVNDLLGWDIVERAAWNLYSKYSNIAQDVSWANLNNETKRKYIGIAQSVLACVMEMQAEKRTARASKDLDDGES